MVRTQGSHPCNRSSTLLGVTKIKNPPLGSFFIRGLGHPLLRCLLRHLPYLRFPPRKAGSAPSHLVLPGVALATPAVVRPSPRRCYCSSAGALSPVHWPPGWPSLPTSASALGPLSSQAQGRLLSALARELLLFVAPALLSLHSRDDPSGSLVVTRANEINYYLSRKKRVCQPVEFLF